MSDSTPHPSLDLSGPDESAGSGPHRRAGGETDAVAAGKVVAAFLEAAQDIEGGLALYDLHAAEAPLWFKKEVLPRSSVDRETYARLHRAIATAPEENGALAWPRRLPNLVDPVLVSWQLDGPDRGIAWLTVTESQDVRTISVAAGLVREDGAWKIDWAVAAAAPAPWSFAMGRAQTIGEFTYRVAKFKPRTWVDIAYVRLYRLDTPKLLTIPGARFSCQGSGVCCKYDFDVSLPPSAQVFIDALPWSEIRPGLVDTQLPETPDGRVRLKASGETCRFLDEHQHCLIHKAVGRAVFSPCHVFPFSFAETPEGIAVTTSHVCGSVRNDLGLPLEARTREIHDRLFLYNVRQPKEFRLFAGVDVPWEVFRDVEVQVMTLLDRQDLPLYRRLWLISRFFEQLLEGQWFVDTERETETIPPLPPEGRAQIAPLMPYMMSMPRLLFEELAGTPIPAVTHAGLRGAPLLTKLFKSLLFSKAHSYPYDLLTAHNLMCILYLLALTLQAYFPDEDVPERLWSELGAEGSHGSLVRLLFPEGTEAGDQMLKMVNSLQYGFWVLRYPLAP